jgi:hypothetical protein
MVIGLVVIGFVLIGVGVWILRQTRADLEVLAPLERMGDGDWKKRDPSTQRRMLDELRPEGAQPLRSTPMAPPIDAEFEHHEHPVPGFSDLGPGVAAEQQRDPTPTGAATAADDAPVESEDAPVESEDAPVESEDAPVESKDTQVEPS